MSTLDQKAPPPAVGSADLLDTLVQDHLARTETSRAQAEELSLEEALSQLGVDAAPAAPVAAAPAAAEAVDAEDSVQLLQREIETLLRGDAAVDAEPAAREAEESALAEATASAEADPAMLLEAELRTLLPGAGAAPAAEVTAAAAPERFSDLPGEEGFLGDGDDVGDETARQLSEAEGVLAAELAQLMAEATTAPKAAPLPAAAESVSAPAAVAAEAAAVKPVVASAAVVAPTAAVGGPATGQVPAVISAATMPPPVVIELPETDAEAELSGAAPRLGIVAQVRQVVMGVLLLIAQLIDMPFAKINDMDKNVLGFVAFLLLLSGCVMYWLSLIYK